MKVFKNNRNHWQANSHIELDNSRLLRIVTMKTYSGVITTQAMVMHREKQGITSHSPFSDYSRLINESKARCTEKLVTDLHVEAIKNLDDLRIEAVNHYQGANHV
jgi:hypothetical protein